MSQIGDLVRMREACRTGRARDLRIGARLTLDEIARQCGGVTRTTVMYWETSRAVPRGEPAVLYAKVLRELEGLAGK